MKNQTTFQLKLFVVIFLCNISFAFGQTLKPGFDKEEYKELMYVSARTGASRPEYYADIPESKFKMVYRSPVVGMDNLWDLWTDNKSTAVISIRGTTEKPESWLENFYAAMVPATGTMHLSPTDSFPYKLASNPRAAVHVGWLLSLAYMSKDILAKIDSSYKTGTRNILLMGHSQGGAINFLLTSFLYHLQLDHKLPADIRFKTYCSAGPKPGNLYYAYDYESLTQNGWAYNVVNAADWVPETPMSIQTLHDYNTTNPFINADAVIKKQSLLKRLALRHVFNKLDRPTRKAQRIYEKYLGRMVAKAVVKHLREFQPPAYYKSNDYVRTGNNIVLATTPAYLEKFPDSQSNVFIHHLHKPYLFLLDLLPEK